MLYEVYALSLQAELNSAGTLAPVAFWTVLLAPCLSSVLPCASGASMAAPAASSGRRHDPAMAVKGRAHHER